MSIPPQLDVESASPFEKIDRTMTKTLGLGIYRFLLLAFVVGQFWLSANYVKKSEFEKIKDGIADSVKKADFEKLKDDIADIKITMRLQIAQSGRLEDHESRIRILENKR